MAINVSVQYSGELLPDIILFKAKSERIETFQLVKRFKWEQWL